MAEALISVLIEQLSSIIQKQVEQEVRLVVGVKKEVAKLTSNFKDIEVVLENAEERQMKEVDVRQWLERLRITEILKQHIQKQEAGNAGSTSTTKKVRFSIPAPWFCFGRQVVLCPDIAVNIEELNERLALIASERLKYDFQFTKRGIEQIDRQKNSSFVDKTFGRVDEKDKVVEKLVSGSGQGGATCLVIPITGMGGIGKTTLAKLAYNDEKVQAHFHTRIWVCVSDPVDEIKIAKAIIVSLTKETPHSNELQTLKSIIHEFVKGKKFLLVLDDVWNQDYGKWEQLKLPLQKEKVVRMVGAQHMVNLEVLREENCWALFYHIALADREKNESKGLEFIGKEIVKKCKGLPLATKALGDELGNITGCKMHDVVHDFLQFLTKNECLALEAEGGNNKRIMEFDGCKKVRHLTLMFAPEELISQVKCLRTLNLSHNFLKEVPNEVGEFAHLRYLDLSDNHDLMKLPDTVCNLINLQTLRLIRCWAFERLPKGMGKLINLQHLHVMGCVDLKLPKGIERLTSLRTLDEVHIHGDDDVDNNKEALFELSDLRNMDQLHGRLFINFKKDLKDARQAGKAHLGPKRIHEETVNALQPHPNLESLFIYGYSGTTLRPHWMTSLNKLRSLTLRSFDFVKFVPPLGRLESLEVLVIYQWPSVKKVGGEFLEIDGTIETKTSPLILFPSLKRLEFNYLPMWEEREGMTGWSEEEDSQKTITIMPCLSSLRISFCLSLKTLPNFLRNTSLKELVIDEDCSPTLAQGCLKGRGEWPKISHIPNIKVGFEFVQKDGVYQTDDDETPCAASTSSSGNVC
ncbi:hypothetical protein PRUPE_3G088000 [Prunus persica]|uniref:NB-ARC domain-containing protein n=1 Tax=Prunus persica TaxID=3760 RepID=A0A251PXI4_PRUPE|nr:hypothetical protein PRUPE_3G088000 [Prunus persica]